MSRRFGWAMGRNGRRRTGGCRSRCRGAGRRCRRLHRYRHVVLKHPVVSGVRDVNVTGAVRRNHGWAAEAPGIRRTGSEIALACREIIALSKNHVGVGVTAARDRGSFQGRVELKHPVVTTVDDVQVVYGVESDALRIIQARRVDT